ncbi:GFA family protein [Labrys wisconsinensis]|uniref:CENP-V/GFA domain-containing protein n=1 Tax=Labrys wisconsinensis TaxID=425677 RepID=A0ABU0JLU5_9HYPH|nr:GFA family protein [Labrys wisconsinensis]MDQ0475266.1 hypothetical protein [Labrys wisconsinensis]
MAEKALRATGGCLCGGVRYEIRGELRPVIACHCSQCARTSGHFVAATSCAAADLTLVSDATLTWYRSSDIAERGFCRTCGGNLFWKPDQGDAISITAGTLDRPTGLAVAEHIYVGSKSDYYQIRDGLPQQESWDA